MIDISLDFFHPIPNNSFPSFYDFVDMWPIPLVEYSDTNPILRSVLHQILTTLTVTNSVNLT